MASPSVRPHRRSGISATRTLTTNVVRPSYSANVVMGCAARNSAISLSRAAMWLAARSSFAKTPLRSSGYRPTARSDCAGASGEIPSIGRLAGLAGTTPADGTDHGMRPDCLLGVLVDPIVLVG